MNVVLVLIVIGLLILAKVHRDKPLLPRSAAGPRCPNCGGLSFVPKRSVIGKAGLGVLAPKSEVRCVTCGKTYRRG